MKELYKKHLEFLFSEYDRILEASPFEEVLIHSGAEIYQFLDDSTYPFKCNPHFKYWIPITDVPNCYISYRTGKKPVLYYYRPVDFWHEMSPVPEGFWSDFFELKLITKTDEVKDAHNWAQCLYIGESVQYHSSWGFKDYNHEATILEFHFIRAAKTPYEQKCLREANKLGAGAHLEAKKAFYEGASEFEINQRYLNYLGVMQDQTPYSNIICLNENAAILHYRNCRPKKYAKGELHSFLIDAGAAYNGYASDITRTYSFEDKEFSELIDEMDKRHLQIISEIKPNVSYQENHLKGHEHVAHLLSDFKFVDLDVEGILEKKISNAFFPHGLGHLLGLQVHDVGGFLKDPKGTQVSPSQDHPFLRCTREIQVGHVLTIEPGLYFIKPLLDDLKKAPHANLVNWDKVERFMKFGGIRIEDNICVTESGVDNYTRDAFSELI